MAKKIDYYEDFLRTEEIREKISQKEKLNKITYSLGLLILTLLATFLISIKSSSLPDFFANKQNKDTKEINLRVDKLTSELENISNSLKDNKDSSFVYLNSKIQNLEQKNSYLYETILENPDSAITPKILREEQINLDGKINDLRSQISKTNSLLSNILTALIIGILGFIAKQIWDAYFRKKTF